MVERVRPVVSHGFESSRRPNFFIFNFFLGRSNPHFKAACV